MKRYADLKRAEELAMKQQEFNDLLSTQSAVKQSKQTHVLRNVDRPLYDMLAQKEYQLYNVDATERYHWVEDAIPVSDDKYADILLNSKEIIL